MQLCLRTPATNGLNAQQSEPPCPLAWALGPRVLWELFQHELVLGTAVYQYHGVRNSAQGPVRPSDGRFESFVGQIRCFLRTRARSDQQ